MMMMMMMMVACRLAERVTFLHMAVIRFRNPETLHCHKRPWKGALHKWLTKTIIIIIITVNLCGTICIASEASIIITIS